MKKLLLLLLVFFSSNYQKSNISSNVTAKRIKHFTSTKVQSNKICRKDSIAYCMEAIKLIKSREGFINHKYKCPAGKMTICYGHQLLPKDSILKKYDTYTIEQGDSILNEDFISRMLKVRKLLGDSVPVNKVIALTGYCFTNGEYAFQTKIYPLIKKGILTKSIYLSYHHYRSYLTGKTVHSELLLKTRKWEWDLYSIN